MQTATIDVPGTYSQNFFSAVAEKLNTIGGNTYVQIGTVISLVGMVAWFISFKVNAETAIIQSQKDIANLQTELKEIRQELPSRDWLELKFQNLEAQLSASKSKGK